MDHITKDEINKIDKNLKMIKIYKSKINILDLEIKCCCSHEEKSNLIKKRDELIILINKLEYAISSLSAKSRTFVDLRYMQQMTYDEIGQRMKYTKNYLSNKIRIKALTEIALSMQL